MKAISTRYLGPTNAHSSRILAKDAAGNRITVEYPWDRNMAEDAHSVAALALCRKMEWWSDERFATHLIAGPLANEYVFVFALNPENRYDIYPLPQRP